MSDLTLNEAIKNVLEAEGAAMHHVAKCLSEEKLNPMNHL